MVIDTSVLVAILLQEPEAQTFARAIEANAPRRLSAANLLEAAIVIETRRGEAGGRELDLMLRRARIEVAPVDSEQVELAREAWRCFGKGRNPAGLNFGDCFAYALAMRTGEPLLFKGDDFARTDITPA